MLVYMTKAEGRLVLGALRIVYSRMTQEQQAKADHIIKVIESCMKRQDK